VKAIALRLLAQLDTADAALVVWWLRVLVARVTQRDWVREPVDPPVVVGQ